MNKQVRRFMLAILVFHARQMVGCTSFLARSELGESWLLSHRSFGWFSTWPREPVKSLLARCLCASESSSTLLKKLAT